MSRRGTAVSVAILLAGFCPVSVQASGPGKVTLHGNTREDAYILSRGDHTMMTGGGLDDVREARRRFSGAFLWIRRAGREYVVRDARLIDEAATLFAPLKSLDPDRAAFELRRARFEQEESTLDREEKRLDRDADRLQDDERPAAGSESRASLERRRQELETRRRSLEEQERDLDGAETSLDRREDEIEKKAEAQLWRLLDRAIESGLAQGKAGSGRR
ncbi:MAG: hypothetical protein LC796_15390 [Acidobacteria bacterium]|nr:hypothetical protein [Acidobacteriota bacterium]MCA1609266.1 hypothetical protein [Acidobacteriota bacterium]